jgi:hypothetical protein
MALRITPVVRGQMQVDRGQRYASNSISSALHMARYGPFIHRNDVAVGIPLRFSTCSSRVNSAVEVLAGSSLVIILPS